jgi:hypothetical protein
MFLCAIPYTFVCVMTSARTTSAFGMHMMQRMSSEPVDFGSAISLTDAFRYSSYCAKAPSLTMSRIGSMLSALRVF